MCCSQIPLHKVSSSARLFQRVLTCAARQREVASRWERIVIEISRGKTANGSIRMR